ncbi:MAG TPA: hydroxyacid dehydrogenase [Terriglobales bacterium]|jgi:phosphoglycerate dehydrogenase-like enzyme|nr:hydroxyacid dehydrogenase [Terriglobales bacterium]
MSVRIFLAPAPRLVHDIFDSSDLARLRALGDLIIYEKAQLSDAEFDAQAASAHIIIGQIDLPESRLRRASSLRAIINVEGNFLPNVDYGYCFAHSIRVLTISPVFAEPVAEAALGMAIDLGRGITRSDRRFRNGTEVYGLEANRDAFALYRQDVGFIGMGDLGRALLPLLRPFGCRIRAYDPWLPGEYIQSLGCESASLDEVLRSSRVIFVVAGVTSENQGFLGSAQFAAMQPGTALVLVSRAAVVDFDAMLDFSAKGHIRVATDVFPEEPLGAKHRARSTDNIILCAHQAGALESAIRQIGKLVVADTELIARGLPPVVCKPAQLETVGLMRSKPVSKT